jgi:NAD(P)-dependent dehydrogenase (short-subunit alcohol dehydrogenase family)
VHPFAGAAYATSKAALAEPDREMASDFGPLEVRVNAISPARSTPPSLARHRQAGRRADPDEPARHPGRGRKAIYFLVTDASSYVNGAELHINGGQHV